MSRFLPPVLSIILGLTLSVSAKTSKNVYEETWKSIVLYALPTQTGPDGSEFHPHCTAWAARFDPMVYITARHCVDGMPLGTIDGALVTVVKAQGHLAALAGPGKSRPMLILGARPVMGQHYTGMGFGGPVRFPFVYRSIYMGDGQVMTTPDMLAVFQSNYVQGMSGGPIIDDEGRVVSTVECGGSYGGHNADFGCGSTYDEFSDFYRSVTVR